MRIVTASLLLACCLPGVANAQAPNKCGQLQIVNKIQLIRSSSNTDLVPVTVNGAQQYFIFDTGGYFTSVAPHVVMQLDLPTDFGSVMTDMAGHTSAKASTIREFVAGKMRGTYLHFEVEPEDFNDGLFALDRWQGVDLDIDFGDDTLNMFSRDHCPGGVQYWTAPAIAVVPISVDGNHVIVPVTLDGHEEQAIIDTGATYSVLDQPEAQTAFGLTPGNSDTPQMGTVNGSAVKEYSHAFKSLTFGDIAVSNPKVFIIPGSSGTAPGSARRDMGPLRKEKMIIGMDVLRKLHVYFAFGEKKMYISQASVPTPEYLAQQAEQLNAVTQEQAKARHDIAMASLDTWSADSVKAGYRKLAETGIAAMNKQLSANPGDAAALATRCFRKATLKEDLDAALSDCDQAIKLKPDNADYLTRRGLVLYQQDKYRDALETFNAALAINPKYAQALLMRGATKGKLGDSSGHDTDIAAARAVDDKVETMFKPFDVAL